MFITHQKGRIEKSRRLGLVVSEERAEGISWELMILLRFLISSSLMSYPQREVQCQLFYKRSTVSIMNDAEASVF